MPHLLARSAAEHPEPESSIARVPRRDKGKVQMDSTRGRAILRDHRRALELDAVPRRDDSCVAGTHDLAAREVLVTKVRHLAERRSSSGSATRLPTSRCSPTRTPPTRPGSTCPAPRTCARGSSGSPSTGDASRSAPKQAPYVRGRDDMQPRNCLADLADAAPKPSTILRV